MQLDKIFLNFGLAKSAAELATLFLVLLLISTIFWLLIGRFKLHNFLINIYVAMSILQVFPKDQISNFKNFQLVVFLGLLVILTVSNKYLFDIHQSGSGLAIWQVFVMSFLEVVLLISIFFSFLQQKEILKFISKDALAYFLDPWWKFGWVLAPLIFLIFIKKREK